MAAAELGLAVDDPARPLTLTGGLTFGGGPGNNYGTHAIASDGRRPPGRPRVAAALVTGLGWYVTKHCIGIYGSEAPGSRPGPERTAAESTGTAGAAAPAGLPEGTETDRAGGFAWASPSAPSPPSRSAHRTPMPRARSPSRPTPSPTGERARPLGAVVACRTPDGRRAWANVTDPDHLALLVTEEGCGRLGTLRPDGQVDLG